MDIEKNAGLIEESQLFKIKRHVELAKIQEDKYSNLLSFQKSHIAIIGGQQNSFCLFQILPPRIHY